MSSNKSENWAQYRRHLKDTYLTYREFGFLKKKSIRFTIIFSLVAFAIFWRGAEVPDFDNAPRHVTVGQYYCPKVGGRGYGNAKIDGISYYHDWSKVFGFWTRARSCNNAWHQSIVEVHWINFEEKRIILELKDGNGVPLPGYERQSQIKIENARSDVSVYLWRLVAMLLALLLMIKTDWKNQGSEK